MSGKNPPRSFFTNYGPPATYVFKGGPAQFLFAFETSFRHNFGELNIMVIFVTKTQDFDNTQNK